MMEMIYSSNYFTVVENKMKFFENKSDICGIAPSFKIIEEDAETSCIPIKINTLLKDF